MNAQHGEAHERVLERVLGGDADRSDADVTALVERCPTCRDKLRHLDEVVRRLDDAGGIGRQVLREAAVMTGAPGEDRIGALVRARAPRSKRAVLWLAAAAALLLAALWLSGLFDSAGSSRQDLYLDTPHRQGLVPHGRVESFAAFSWQVTRPLAGSFRVVVFDARDEARANPLLTGENLEETTWMPTSEQARALPAEIYWEVQVLDALRQVVESEGTRASLSSR